VATAPSVAYQVTLLDGDVSELRSPQDLPEPNDRESISEPYVRAMILTPTEFVGPIMELATSRRAIVGNMNYLSPERVELDFEIPLAEIVFDFFDLLKSKTKGYATLDYEPAGYREADLVRVDILLNQLSVDAFSAIVHRDNAPEYGKKMTSRLRELIPRQLFDVPIQAAIGGRIISRETVKAKRKDVTAKCYGGDISRKKKLLQRQKEGKKRMKMVGSVEVPQEAFVAALKVDEES
jgi:GTP-binding protein LepA